MIRRRLLASKYKIMLDSGAYTAWSKLQTIDIDAYIAFIKEHYKWIDSVVNLDVIPGAYGRHPTPEETEVSAREGWKNLLYMESHGLKPIPVYHQGEDFKWLQKMIDHQCPYIGISPANDRTTKQKRIWLDEVFDQITNKEGKCIVKTHGFGVTSIPLLLRYPWFSADSTTWSKLAAYGSIMVPDYNKPYPDNLKAPFLVRVSMRSPDRFRQGQHFISYPQEAKSSIIRYLETINTRVTEAAEDYKVRLYVNAMFFQQLNAYSVSLLVDKKGVYRQGMVMINSTRGRRTRIQLLPKKQRVVLNCM